MFGDTNAQGRHPTLQFSVSCVHWPFLSFNTVCPLVGVPYTSSVSLITQDAATSANILSYVSIGKYPHHVGRPFAVVVFSTQRWRNRQKKCIKNELIIKMAKHYKNTFKEIPQSQILPAYLQVLGKMMQSCIFIKMSVIIT